jgi:hypothetical protein
MDTPAQILIRNEIDYCSNNRTYTNHEMGYLDGLRKAIHLINLAKEKKNG